MKKEQNAEKTKVRKLARTKEKVSQWTTNPLNEKVLDYHNYEMTKSESVLYFVAAFLVGGVVSQFFYGGLFQEDGVPTLLTYISNSAAFVIVGLLVGKVFLPVRSRQLAEKRRDTLRRQFRDMLESLTASLAANSTVRDAFSSAYTDMCMQYSDDALISKELDQFRRAEQINVTLNVMMDDFAKRSGVEEIQDIDWCTPLINGLFYGLYLESCKGNGEGRTWSEVFDRAELYGSCSILYRSYWS